MIICALAGSTYYFYTQFQRTQRLLQNPDAATQEDRHILTAQVAKLILLPSDEVPQIATVLDASLLKNQPFFVNAKNGDRILIYPKAMKALLFRPSEQRIIEIQAFSEKGVDLPQPAATPQPATLKIVISNGTKTVGLTQVAQTELTDKFANVHVVAKINAKSQNYETTLIVDLTRKNKDIATILAKDLHATVTALPSGEESPTAAADILIILGKNYGQ